MKTAQQMLGGAPGAVAAARVDVAIQGARMHYAVPRMLARADLLGSFYTDAYLGNKPYLRRLLSALPESYTPLPVRRLIGRQALDIPNDRVVSFDTFGLKTVWSMRQVSSYSALQHFYARGNRIFCEKVAKTGFSGAAAVYALNGASLEIFRAAKQRGMLCVFEQTIAPVRVMDRLLAEELQLWPGAQNDPLEDYHNNPLALREEAEWRLADCIVCGSEFVAAGLQSQGVPRAKCRVVPYGIDTSTFRPRNAHDSQPALNILFVGALGLRKGVPYLLEAVRELGPQRVRCRLVGAVELNQKWLAERLGQAELMGQVPRSRIMSMFDWADVFVLPSICEGSATVIYEALGCGLPVIATPNAGSVVRDGLDGFIVPIRDPGALAARIRQLCDDRALLRTMSENARQRGREFDVNHYGDRIISLIHSLLPSANQ